MSIKAWDEDHEISDYSSWGFPSYGTPEDEATDEIQDEEIEETTEESEPEGQEEEEEEVVVEEEEEEEKEEESTEEESTEEEEPVEEEPKFKTYKEKSEYYENRLKELNEKFNPDNLKKTITEQYKEELLAAEQETEQVKALYQVIKGDPTAFIKHYLGEAAGKMGYNTQMNAQEKKSAVHFTLQQEFGVGYETEFNAEELLDPTSTSAQIYQRAQQVAAAIDERQQQLQQAAPNTVNVFEDKNYLDKEYNENFASKGVTKEQYEQFVSHFQERFPKLSMLDMHRAVYYEDYMNHAFKMGIEEGKKALSKDIKNAGGKMKPVVNNTQPAKKLLTEDDIFDFYRNTDYSAFQYRR